MRDRRRAARKLRLSFVLALVASLAAGCALVVGVDFDKVRREPFDGALTAPVADTTPPTVPTSVSDAKPEAGPSNGCPAGRGPMMVALDAHHCIDATEVTVGQYRAFLSELASDAGAAPRQPATCSWNTTFEPVSPLPDPNMDRRPVNYVNWCQARAFCEWAGKRLCGAFDGGAITIEGGSEDPAVSLWMSACSDGGGQAYPYGRVLDETACNFAIADQSPAPIADVGSFPRCEGSLPGLYDILGNVKEWEDSCDEEDPADSELTPCNLRGGGMNVDASTVTCSLDERPPRSLARFSTGVRCCATLP